MLRSHLDGNRTYRPTFDSGTGQAQPSYRSITGLSSRETPWPSAEEAGSVSGYPPFCGQYRNAGSRRSGTAKEAKRFQRRDETEDGARTEETLGGEESGAVAT